VGNLLPEKTTQIYYIVQEAITNIIKHSQADRAEVLLEGGHDFIYVTITDNGRGISHHDVNLKQKYGIRSMKERAQRVNGIFKIEKLLKGTRIQLKIPWEETLL
jgi:signal transduction histidine kinase